jgi:hypothetical protein
MRLVAVKDKKEPLVDIKFNVFKFSERMKPNDFNKITIISCLSEFGCETIGCLYCLPRIVHERKNDYKIAVGWYGREYFYRHLVDEFWEIQEECQFLRDYCKAFHHESRNLAKLERTLQEYGNVVTSENVGRIVVGNKCLKCGNFWGDTSHVMECPECHNNDIIRSLFGDVKKYRKQIVLIPKPSSEKLIEADKYLKPNPVGIFARGRTTYGRNLQPEFYIKLIELVESLGFNPIWLGEKQSTLECPVPHVFDFSRSKEARDLELTCAIVSKLKFTIQYWTASTRLAALMGTPHLLFESPQQIWGQGQEGYRLALLKGLAPSKMVMCHFLSAYNDNETTLKLTKQAIEEMNSGNYADISGMVDQNLTRGMKYSARKDKGL